MNFGFATARQSGWTAATKGQLISEWLFGVLNFPKSNAKIGWNSALKSKEWSNQKDQGTFNVK